MPGPSSILWIKQFWNTLRNDISEGFRISGENLFAEHSIHYSVLKSYFYVFAIWNEKNIALSWDDTIYWAELLGLTTVDVFYRGIFNRYQIHTTFDAYCKQSKDLVEGYVVRLSKEILYNEIDKNRCLKSIFKWVRRDHVTTDDHWMYQPNIPNELDKFSSV